MENELMARYAPMPIVDIDFHFTSDEVAAAARDGQRAMASDIVRLLRPGYEAMDIAAATVIALGYQPSECMLEVERLPSGGERRTLKVLDQPCFEVTVEPSTLAPPDWTIEVTTTPRLIGWPEAR